MIKPGTPVRGRADVGDEWSESKWFYIGPTKDGWHIVEDEKGGTFTWGYVEPLPRKIHPGDEVYTSDISENALRTEDDIWIFDGMYKNKFVCAANGAIHLFKYAIRIEDLGD